MKRAVVDTNILIRALIKPRGSVVPVLTLLASNSYRLIYSRPLLDELVEKLALPRIRVKYNLDDETIEATLALIALRGELVKSNGLLKFVEIPTTMHSSRLRSPGTPNTLLPATKTCLS